MENKFFGSKFYNSIFNTILLFVLIVLMIIALRFMFKNQEVYLPLTNKSEETQNINQSIQKVESIDENSFVARANGLVVIDSISHIFYNSKPAYHDSASLAIVSSQNKDSVILEPECGGVKSKVSSITSLYIPPCVFLLQKEDGAIKKIGEWPDESFLENNENFDIYSYENGSLRRCLDNDLYQNCSDSDNKIYFTSNSSPAGCGASREEWSLDLNSGEFLLEKSKPLNDC